MKGKPKVALVDGEPAYIKTVFHIGKSHAVTLPAEWFWLLGEEVDEVAITIGEGAGELRIRPYRRAGDRS